jgi:nicotinamide riboside kinase
MSSSLKVTQSSIWLNLIENWLDWLNDEFDSAKTDEEKKEVLKLCERALEENLCKFVE